MFRLTEDLLKILFYIQISVIEQVHNICNSKTNFVLQELQKIEIQTKKVKHET